MKYAREIRSRGVAQANVKYNQLQLYALFDYGPTPQLATSNYGNFILIYGVEDTRRGIPTRRIKITHRATAPARHAAKTSLSTCLAPLSYLLLCSTATSKGRLMHSVDRYVWLRGCAAS